MSPETNDARPRDFIRDMVEEDLASDKYGGRVVTRFPPEPNGYLHIGHAKSICLNFGIAEEYDGRCHLRFDDTNPTTEDPEYVEAIQEDIRWLGFDWGENRFFASDYFERLYDYAVELIEAGKAYVDSSSEEEIRAARGTVTEPGRQSPFRDRSVEENLDLFRRMRAGEFGDGEHVLRARIDMAAANMKMRDPILYRIRHAHHYRRGDEWCLYPMYDHAHCLSDAIERITHSLCTLEFENNRELYDWILANTSAARPLPEQTEFARLNLSYTVLSKRRLLELVEGGHVDGWDDPRMPTLSGLRRRGYTPESIRSFCDAIGVAKANSIVDVAQLEHAVRDDLNYRAPRLLCVLDPIRVVITNYPEGEVDELEAPYFPEDIGREGSRSLPFQRHILIERADFSEEPPKGFWRMTPGRDVRLRYAYIVHCDEVVRSADGEILEVRCTYDPATRGGEARPGQKVRGTIHWVSAGHGVPIEARLYDRLFDDPRPDQGKGGPDFKSSLNPSSLEIVSTAVAEPSVADFEPGSHVQFERQGFFFRDPGARADERPVFNRTVSLRDTWAKRERDAGVPAEIAESEPTADQEPAARPPTPGEPPALTRRQTRVAAELGQSYGLTGADAERLARDDASRAFFEAAVAVHDNPSSLARWLLNEVRGELGSERVAGSEAEPPLEPRQLAELVALVDAGRINSTIAKQVLCEVLASGVDPTEIVRRDGLETISDRGELERLVASVLEAHPEQAEQYRQGKTALIGFFIGRVMERTDGRADPVLVRRLIEEALA